MFPSPKSHNSPNNSNLYKTINDTYNGIPKITSTPLHSLPARRHGIPFSTSSKPRLLSLRRYSLSDVPSLTNGKTPPRNNDTSGPLLTSLNYKDNVSIYEETKSSGLAGRVVQYSEEQARKQKPLCQEKYNSPGLFPIVHLFNKKDSLEQLPKPVVIKIGTPEMAKHIHPEHSKKILESITKPVNSKINSTANGLSQTQNSSRTENVLDALKEISRKRIHSNEDFELHEDHGKKQRTVDNKSCNSNKRPQDNSLEEQSPNSSCRPVSKKICVYDEYAASRSSTNFSTIKKNNQQFGTKRKTISTSTEFSPFEQTKYVNAETQTTVVEPEKEIAVEDKQEKISTSTRESPVKVFNEVPLEKNRKNRLAALMGTLVGKEVALLPKLKTENNINENPPENIQKIDNDTTKDDENIGKPLTSILSHPNQTRTPNNKHVHFSISEDSSKEANSQLDILDRSTSNSGSDSNKISNKVTLTPALVSLPSFSQAICKSDNSVWSTAVTSSPLISTSAPLTPKISQTGGFAFSLIPSNNSDSSPKQVSASFGPLKESADTNALKESETDKSLVTYFTVTTSQPTLGFKNSNTSSSSFVVSPIVSTPFNLDMSKTPNDFEKVNASSYFGAAHSSPLPTITTSSFTSILPPSSSTGFGGFTVTTCAPSSSVVTSTFVFGNNSITTSGFQNSNVLTSNTSEKISAFNLALPPATTTSATLLTGVTMPSTLFTTTLPGNTSTISFGTKPATSSTNSAFGNVFTPLFGGSTSSQSVPPITVTSSLNFANPNTVPSFKTTPSTFGVNSSIASTPFGVATTTPSFTSNTSPMPAAFGINPTTASGSFGSATLSATFGGFVTPTAPSFGNAANLVASFDKSTPTTFGTVNATTASGFGNPSNNSSFGINNSFTAQTVFGTTTKPSFSTESSAQANATTTTSTTPSVFGSAAAATFTFGGKMDNPFGVTKSSESVSKQNAGFFSTTSPSFGSVVSPTSGSSFGQNNGSVLGNKPATFGGHSVPFGNSDKGVGSVFQGGKAAAGFAKPEVAQIGFGSAASTFGSPSGNVFGSQQQPASNGTPFAFGSVPSQAAPSGTFNFGSNNALEKSKSFSFGGGTVKAFVGSSSTPSFQSGSPAFGTPAGSFSTPGLTTGVFNIGSGPASTSRARAPLKARRRT